MMVMLLLIYLVGLAKAGPIALDKRQIAVRQTSDSASGDSSAAVPLSAIIATSTILGVGILIVLSVSLALASRYELTSEIQIRRWKAKKATRQAEGTRATSLISITAEDLAGTRRNGRTDNSATADTNVVGNGNGNGRRGRRSRGRALRRTESGRSVKTLPEYSKEAGDEELVLVRYAISLIPAD